MKLSFLIVPRLEPYTSYFHILSWKSHHPHPLQVTQPLQMPHNLSKCHATSPQMMKPVITSCNLSFHLVSSAKTKQPLLKSRNLSSNCVSSPQVIQPFLKYRNSYHVTQPLQKSGNISYLLATSPIKAMCENHEQYGESNGNVTAEAGGQKNVKNSDQHAKTFRTNRIISFCDH